jgi:hypothetical protein
VTDSRQCDKCGRHFTSTENRIELAKFHIGPSYEYIPYLTKTFALIANYMIKECPKSVGDSRILTKA